MERVDGGRKLAKLNPSDVDAFYQQLRVSGSVDGQPLAPSTIRRIHGILRRALAQGVRWGWIGVNPAVASSPPRVPPTDITPPNPEQLAGLLERSRREYPELACFILLAASTGARRSELIALWWSDIDFDDSTIGISRATVIGISRATVIGNHGLVEKDTKTHLSRRVSTCGRSRGAWGIATLRPRSTSTPISSSGPIASQPT